MTRNIQKRVPEELFYKVKSYYERSIMAEYDEKIDLTDVQINTIAYSQVLGYEVDIEVKRGKVRIKCKKSY